MLISPQRDSAPNEQPREGTQGGGEPSGLPLQLCLQFISLHLGQLDRFATHELTLHTFSMVTRFHMPIGHGVFINTECVNNSRNWTSM
jgi:hypothetical protein